MLPSRWGIAMTKMKVIPLAFDSLGVRSTATWVETDQKILIDPGAALGPLRYGLPPSKIEYRRLEELARVIISYAEKSDILIVSHYHYDHHFPEQDFYEGKILLIKDPKNKINYSQKQRGKEFLGLLGSNPLRIEFADGKEFEFGKTRLKFSPPFFHGKEYSKLGYVLITSVSYEGEKLLHASDIQGPQTKITTDWIISENPDVLILSGYPTLFIGWRFSRFGLLESNQNLIKILSQTKVNTIILDHHLVRDLHYLNKIEEVLKTAEELKKKVITAAEFLGKKPDFLEARRKEFYQ
jgi:predicted metallo-beta-lactamase superfamily hydrolase